MHVENHWNIKTRTPERPLSKSTGICLEFKCVTPQDNITLKGPRWEPKL